MRTLTTATFLLSCCLVACRPPARVAAPAPTPATAPTPPALGDTERPPRIDFATWCRGTPRHARWIRLHSAGSGYGSACLLPWKVSSGLGPYSTARGWVDLDLHRCATKAGGIAWGGMDRRSQTAPRFLHIRLRREHRPGRSPGYRRGVRVRVRRMRGRRGREGYRNLGWGRWRTVLNREPIGHGAVFLRIPMKRIVGDADHWVQVQVDVHYRHYGPAPYMRRVDLLWPASCKVLTR